MSVSFHSQSDFGFSLFQSLLLLCGRLVSDGELVHVLQEKDLSVSTSIRLLQRPLKLDSFLLPRPLGVK